MLFNVKWKPVQIKKLINNTKRIFFLLSEGEWSPTNKTEAGGFHCHAWKGKTDLTVSILKCRFVELSVNIDLAPGKMSGFATFRGNDNFSNQQITGHHQGERQGV